MLSADRIRKAIDNGHDPYAYTLGCMGASVERAIREADEYGNTDRALAELREIAAIYNELTNDGTI